MLYLRLSALLLIFFGGLYLLRDPITGTGPNVKSSVVAPFQSFLKNVEHALSSIPNYTALPGSSKGQDYVPGGATTSSQVSSATSTTAPALYIPTNGQQDGSYTPPASKDDLTVNGVIALTNVERTKNGIGKLSENSKLDASAQVKLKDMFAKGYFEHISPTGVGVSDLVTDQNYGYIVVGENLALGNFGGDSKLVAAWMASPGHRANILDSRFTDIGVAVGRGIYQGEEVWIAVQHFGKPLSACPGPSNDQKKEIDTDHVYLQTEEDQINTLKAKIDSESGSQYQQDINTYDDLVEDYNARLQDLQTKITAYNQSVKDFNSCAGLN